MLRLRLLDEEVATGETVNENDFSHRLILVGVEIATLDLEKQRGERLPVLS
jgi:hypothetical protein